jgi:23S rRNA pseudouridine1911/1915/1917 synthase
MSILDGIVTGGSSSSASGHIVDEAGAGIRLDRFLASRIETLSRARLQELIRAGRVTANGRPVTDPSVKVRAGESFEVEVPPVEPYTLAGEPIALTVVYEDDSLIVIDKPAGLVVHPGAGNLNGTLVNALIAHCGKSLSGIGGVARPGIVHRLDKDTSGLMVVAKTGARTAALARQFADHGRTGTAAAVSRSYGANRSPRPEHRARIALNLAPWRLSKLAAHVNYQLRNAAYYRLTQPAKAGGRRRTECCRALETGRTSSAVMAHLGTPIAGDSVVDLHQGERFARMPGRKLLGRQALHAVT